MDAIRRTPTLRRVATTASLAALLLPGAAAEADARAKKKPKPPVITAVSPMEATVGDKLTIRGRHFRKGKAKNSVGFKRDGAAVVFVQSDVSTTRMMTVELPAKLEKVMAGKPTRFHLRVLAARFGRAFTPDRLSPVISPRPVEPGEGPPVVTEPPPPPGPSNDCDDDGVKNPEDTDDDNDLLDDARENGIGTDGCDADTDGDGVSDGYEYRSAIDLNDDEYQQPNSTHPYPGALPYPNPLSADADKDHDGDGLLMAMEYDLWVKLTPPDQRTLEDSGDAATPLTYSAGMKYSVSRRCGAGETGGPCGTGNLNQNRRVPTLTGANYDKYQNFLGWIGANGYQNVFLRDREVWFETAGGWNQYGLLDVDRDGAVSPEEAVALDLNRNGYLSDDERDEDADGLSNFDETRGAMEPGFWSACYTLETPYPVEYAGTGPANPDSDCDGVRDGADDQDHDDVPNVMELSRWDASHIDDTDDGIDDSVSGGGKGCKSDKDLDVADDWHPDRYGRVQPFNPCFPDPDSRTCTLHPDIGFEPGPDWWSLQ